MTIVPLPFLPPGTRRTENRGWEGTGMIPEDRKYLPTHEWGKREGNLIVIGITDFAVKHLSDLVYIDLPSTGQKVKKGERFGEIESVKAVSDINSPVTGEVAQVNDQLADHLEALAQDPYGSGWMIKVKPANAAELDSCLDAKAYLQSPRRKGGTDPLPPPWHAPLALGRILLARGYLARCRG
jgi:glycine cleavage system H protein